MNDPEHGYVVSERYELGNLSEATESQERTLHKVLKPRQVSHSYPSELSLIMLLDVDDCPGRFENLALQKRQLSSSIGSIGAGLMVGTGTALSRGTGFSSRTASDTDICTGGPLGMLLGYMYVGASELSHEFGMNFPYSYRCDLVCIHSAIMYRF